MASRRILSVWFPRLGAERLLRCRPELADRPFAVVCDSGQTQVLSALSAGAEAAGLRAGQPLRDAHATCAGLVTQLRNPQAEAAFLDTLARWAGRFSPWVATERPDTLTLDITGCAHLFGGEERMMAQVANAAAQLGLTARCGLADTVGAAWALAHYAGAVPLAGRSGDAIDQEARATRSRAARRRHGEHGSTTPPHSPAPDGPRAGMIAPPGRTQVTLAALPVSALRIDPETVSALNRLGLRRIGDLLGQPRAPLARRFGQGLILRLDQATGATPEPVSPGRAAPCFATRLTLPEPIGLHADMLAALDRLVQRLCDLLADRGQGARRVRLQAFRADGTMDWVEAGLARASDEPDRIRPLLAARLDEIDAGFGIDMLRLQAVVTEPVQRRTVAGHMEAADAARARLGRDTAIEDLIGRIGGRIGLESITRYHPAGTHIPEKTAQVLAAAWSSPAQTWPSPPAPRPLLLWRPEPVGAPDIPHLAARFRWRGRHHRLVGASGPERIAPEWWLDEPDWRSGIRDYWQVFTGQGERLWLFYAHGGTMRSGWFCHGQFA